MSPKNYDFPRRGDVSELAEGARLEIVYMCKTRILGSNPSISAILHSLKQSSKDKFLQELS